jgi:predicted NAD-dependent protein-ADP-ribosyltransferase YbiA (DUF1768 family)
MAEAEEEKTPMSAASGSGSNNNGESNNGSGNSNTNENENENSEKLPNSDAEENDEGSDEEEEEAPAAAAAVAPVAKPKGRKKKEKEQGEPKVKKKRPIPIPKDSASFFRARAKEPRMFNFTADGNLQVPEMRGQAAKIIELPNYRQATIGEQEEGVEKRYVELQAAEKEYDETLRQFKAALQEWRDTGKASDVLKFQRELTRIDAVRTRLRSPSMWTKEFKRLSIRDVLVDEFYQVKKLGYPVYALKMRSLPFEELVRIGEKPAEPTPELAKDEEEEEEDGEAFVFFNNPAEPDHGVLSPDTMIEFVYNSTKYNSLTQAYEGERLKALGRETVRQAVLKQRNPFLMRGLAMKVAGEVENPRELWIEILKSLILQHPRIGEALRTTGDDTLVYANPKESRYGIGLAADDPLALDKGAWKGPNILGQAWQVVRGTLEPVLEGGDTDGEEDEEAASPVLKGGSYTEHGKTAEEAKDIRRNILKGYYRRMGK